MNTIERWFLKRIIAKQVMQDLHDKNIQELYQLIHNASIEEFTEDNFITIDVFLRELFEATQYSPNPYMPKDGL